MLRYRQQLHGDRRRLRPPAPLRVQCRPDGRPLRLYRGGQARTVTHVAASWVRPVPWWSALDGGALSLYTASALNEERTYMRVIVDDACAYEIFCTASGRWYVERIID